MRQSGKPILYGTPDSVYVRIARMALYYKNIDYDFVPVDVFADEGPPMEYLRLNPFGRIPAFAHAGFRLYETSAITRYIDEAFEGRKLVPATIQDRARVNQIISVLDSYCYRTWVLDIYVERVEQTDSNESKIAAALPMARTCFSALADLFQGSDWFVGNAPTLADFHAAPMVAYFLKTAEGRSMLNEFPALVRWWASVSGMECFMQTEF